MRFTVYPKNTRLYSIGLLLVSLTTALTVPSLRAQTKGSHIRSNWPSYAGDKASSKYSPLSQINHTNFKTLKVAWTWRSAEETIRKANPRVKTWVWESTPLMVDGVLYVSTSLSQVAALDAATGKPHWIYDPETWKGPTPPNHGFVHRGVTYWADGADKRILLGTGDGYLVSLNARTGKPIPTFGQKGRIDLTQGLGRVVDRRYYGVTSPPIVCRDVVMVGASILDFPLAKDMPPGDIRGFDVRTGKQRWIFHAIPREGEFGVETWEQDSWKTTGAANVWSMMSADEALGYVYLPFGTPANDQYGGERPGNGLFGECLVCLDARTGKRIWHFQMAHHGVWDYDLPAAPNLIDIKMKGKVVKAVAQVSKQGFCYVFDRVTGKPIWPIVERPVAASTIPGEQLSPTQPFPSRPAAFDRQGMTKEDVIDFTPELRTEALAALEKYNYGPLFTPPSLEKPTIYMPGVAGGASWAGAGGDPETGRLYIPSITFPFAFSIFKSPVPHTKYIGLMGIPATVQGLPLYKPPYGRITAIDLTTGDHAWQVPMGDLLPEDPLKKRFNLPQVGRTARGHMLVTKSLLIIGQEGNTQRGGNSANGFAIVSDFVSYDPTLRAYDKATGKVVGEVKLPRNITGAPMTYLLNNKQYIVFPTGGSNLSAELIALRLP